jgi:hypothetical protein
VQGLAVVVRAVRGDAAGPAAKAAWGRPRGATDPLRPAHPEPPGNASRPDSRAGSACLMPGRAHLATLHDQTPTRDPGDRESGRRAGDVAGACSASSSWSPRSAAVTHTTADAASPGAAAAATRRPVRTRPPRRPATQPRPPPTTRITRAASLCSTQAAAGPPRYSSSPQPGQTKWPRRSASA